MRKTGSVCVCVCVCMCACVYLCAPGGMGVDPHFLCFLPPVPASLACSRSPCLWAFVSVDALSCLDSLVYLSYLVNRAPRRVLGNLAPALILALMCGVILLKDLGLFEHSFLICGRKYLFTQTEPTWTEGRPAGTTSPAGQL